MWVILYQKMVTFKNQFKPEPMLQKFRLALVKNSLAVAGHIGITIGKLAPLETN